MTCFAQILESQYPSTPEGRPVLRGQVSSLEKFVQNGSALNETTKSHLRRVFTIFNNLLEDDPQTFQDNGYTRAKKFAPIELVGVCVLISQHGTGGRSLPMLHGDIRDLRGFLREKHKDLRMNNSVWKDIWEFIDDLEGRRGAADGSTVLKKPKAKGRQTRTSQRIAAADGPSYVEIPEPPAGKEVEAVVPGPTVDGRAVNGDDDDDDDDHVDGEAMLNRFIQAPKTAAEPPNKSPPRPAAAPVATMSSKTQNQPLPTAATVSKTSSLTRREETRPADTPITKASYASRADKNQNLPRPADTSVTNAGSATHDQETTPLIKPERDAPLPTRPIPQVATPASNIKRRAPLDLGSGARALAGKKARLA